MPAIPCAILTISDGCAHGKREDKSGAELEAMALARGWTVEERVVTPDDAERIREHILRWTEPDSSVRLVLCTGGTGLGPRDVTPEALRSIDHVREVPGLAECMRHYGAGKTPKAWLSRSLAAARGRTLVLCLPGSPKGAKESLEAVAGLIPHAIHILEGGGH